MLTTRKGWLAALMLALPLPTVHAQGAPAATAGEPAVAAMPAAKVEFRSTFDGYRGYADQPVGSWREANDTVNTVGGWRAYAKEAAGGGNDDKDGGMSGHHHHGAPGSKP